MNPAFWVVPLAAVLAAPVIAGEPPTSGAADEAVRDTLAAIETAATRSAIEVSVTRGPDGLEVTGECRVTAPAAVVWNVLTDYDGIDAFVSSMKKSRVVAREDDHLLVEQVAVGHVLLFRRQLNVVLWVEEDSSRTIRFEDMLHRDFDSYHGSWRIEARGPEVEIAYRLVARPTFSVPDLIGRGMFRSTVRRLLSEVATEIDRRTRARGTSGETQSGSAETVLARDQQ